MPFVLGVALAVSVPAAIFGLAMFDLGKHLGRDEAADEFRSRRSEIRESAWKSGYEAALAAAENDHAMAREAEYDR